MIGDQGVGDQDVDNQGVGYQGVGDQGVGFQGVGHQGWVVQKLVNFNPGLSENSRSNFFFKKR